MATQRNNEIKVGLVSILAIILFILGITFGRGYKVAVAQQVIKFRFPNSGGIVESSPVVVNGVRRGTILSVKNDDGSVLITADIDDISDLHKDASAKITILEITGGKKIEINPGKSSQSFDITKEIPGSTPGDIGELVSLVSDIGMDARTLVRRFDTISLKINSLLADGKVINELKHTLANADDIVSRLRTFIDGNINDLSITLKNVKAITSDLKLAIKKDEPKLDSLLTTANEALTEARSIVKTADNTIRSADDALRDIKEITGEIKNGKGLVNKLIYDRDLAVRLDSAITELNTFVTFINKNGVNVNLRIGSRP